MHAGLALIFAVLIFFAAIIFWPILRPHKRVYPHDPPRCFHCGHDCRGIPTHRCPECGEDPRTPPDYHPLA
jgi:hypothetical protein